MKKTLIIIVALLVVAGGVVGYLVTHKPKSDVSTPVSTQTTAPVEASTPAPASSTSTTQEAVITYSNSGFSPATLTVKSGTTVTIKNTSSHSMQFDSDPHPAHTDNTELNAGSVASGKSQTFVVDKTGTFGYHNHLNPSDTGTIVVQ